MLSEIGVILAVVLVAIILIAIAVVVLGKVWRENGTSKLNKWVDIVSKVALAVAIPIGGLWALASFILLQGKEACAQRSYISAQISAHQDGRNILGFVQIKNIGTGSAIVNPSTPPIIITPIDRENGLGLLHVSTYAQTPAMLDADKETYMTALGMFPGREVDLYFMSPPLEPGTYLITFSGKPILVGKAGDGCVGLPVNKFLISMRTTYILNVVKNPNAKASKG